MGNIGLLFNPAGMVYNELLLYFPRVESTIRAANRLKRVAYVRIRQRDGFHRYAGI